MKKKGFTLIELLAVIVILAIIALITVPVVINIINNSKKGAAEDSTYGVIESAKLFWVSNQTSSGFESENSTIVFKYTDNKWKVSGGELNGQELQMTGTKPTGDNDSNITISNGNITVSNIKYGDYYCSTNSDGKAVCSKEKTTSSGGGSSTTVTTSGPTKVTVAG
nr:prepilin-type N-terminal cleavage/methylation domain-containing protein [Clostridia bacterium]